MNGLPPSPTGAYSRDSLVDQLGLGRVRSLLRHGELVRYSRGVLVDRHRMLDLPARAAAALMFVGGAAVLCGHTAALLHGCTVAERGRVHVLTDPSRKLQRVRPGLALHHGRFAESDVLELGGLRVLAFDHVLGDLLCTAPRPTALACADEAFSLLDEPFRAGFRSAISTRIAARADPRGRRRGEALLNLASGDAGTPARSWLLLKLVDAGFPPPRLQVPILDRHGAVRHRLHFAWEEPRVALEFQTSLPADDREAEAAAEDLRRRGWLLIRADATDLACPTRLFAELRAAFARRRFAA